MSDLVTLARSYLHVRENPKGSNRSPEIDRWCKAVGAPLASAWCAAFCYSVAREAGHPWPWARSGRVQTLVESGGLASASEAVVGDVVVFYFANLKRYAHIGIVERNAGGALFTVEGNTIADGATGDAREGWGVFAKRRVISDRIKVLRTV